MQRGGGQGSDVSQPRVTSSVREVGLASAQDIGASDSVGCQVRIRAEGEAKQLALASPHPQVLAPTPRPNSPRA